jgi:hypothetical protein
MTGFPNVKEYGVTKTWNNKWETFAHCPDGKYLIPITWARETFAAKKKAENFINKLARKYGWKENNC